MPCRSGGDLPRRHDERQRRDLHADRRGTATITDDDTQPTVTIGDVTVTEGHTGEVNANFPVTLSSAAPATVADRVDDDRRVGDGGVRATTTAPPATLTIPAGQSRRHDQVKVNGDVMPEGTSENFHVDMTSVSGAQFRPTGAGRRRSPTTTRSRRPRSATSPSPRATAARSTRTSRSRCRGMRPRPCRSRWTTTVNGSATAPADLHGRQRDADDPGRRSRAARFRSR